jgi:formylglycine-generating enzyme required for sulfatase activity
MEFVLIPAGTFMMGSPDSDAEAWLNERPTHRVTISQPFYLGKYPVTKSQWTAAVENNPDRFKDTSDCPIENVSWNDVQKFLSNLSWREDGIEYCLPSEAQWEYACRAGTETPRYHSDLDTIAWYKENSHDQPQPVGQKSPNAWGLYDMLGNVWEWCLDGPRLYTEDAVIDPMGPTDDGAGLVIRGGSCNLRAHNVRAAIRFRLRSGSGVRNLGFRCACSGTRR